MGNDETTIEMLSKRHCNNFLLKISLAFLKDIIMTESRSIDISRSHTGFPQE